MTSGGDDPSQAFWPRGVSITFQGHYARSTPSHQSSFSLISLSFHQALRSCPTVFRHVQTSSVLESQTRRVRGQGSLSRTGIPPGKAAPQTTLPAGSPRALPSLTVSTTTGPPCGENGPSLSRWGQDREEGTRRATAQLPACQVVTWRLTDLPVIQDVLWERMNPEVLT